MNNHEIALRPYTAEYPLAYNRFSIAGSSKNEASGISCYSYAQNLTELPTMHLVSSE
jgi:hypothetical protein